MIRISLYRQARKECPGFCSEATIEAFVTTSLQQWQSWLENWVCLHVSWQVTRMVHSIQSCMSGSFVVQMRIVGCKFILPATAGSTLNHRRISRTLYVRLPVRTI